MTARRRAQAARAKPHHGRTPNSILRYRLAIDRLIPADLLYANHQMTDGREYCPEQLDVQKRICLAYLSGIAKSVLAVEIIYFEDARRE